LGRKEIIFMVVKEYFKMAFRNMRNRPLRSWLTILGIVIGVFLITSLFSLSEGLKNTVSQQLSMMGTDLIIVVPGEASNFIAAFMGHLELGNEELDAISETKDVEQVVPVIYKTLIVRYEGESKALLVSGSDWENSMDVYQNDLGLSIKEGRWPVPGKRELLVGSLVNEEIFEDLKINTPFYIKGKRYEIVGILKSMGSKTDDTMLHLDLNLFREITGTREGATQVLVKIDSDASAEKVAEDIKENLAEVQKRKRGQEEMPYSVLTSEKIAGIANDIMGVVELAVFSFASIAIVVGGIGIMNTMYTAVRERRREIGIMKAVGAKGSTIILIFLIESGVIGLVGGVMGVVPGLGLAKMIEAFGQVHPVFYLQASVSPFTFSFGLIFSFLIGCLSGFLPARRAAALKPVEALRRYE